MTRSHSDDRARHLNAVYADIDDAAEAAADLVARGKTAWDKDRMLRLAGEAIIGRIADAAGRLPDDITSAIDDVPWDAVRDIRILVDHIYHRIDYAILWQTLSVDIPAMHAHLRAYRVEP